MSSDASSISQLPIYITAGGRSSRFGSDKARALVDGKPMLQHVADAIGTLASEVTVVADVAGKYSDLGFTTIADKHPGKGPIAALHAALHHCQTRSPTCDWFALISCDLPGLRRSWIESLFAARARDDSVVAFADQFWEPLCALYHKRLLPEVDRRISIGELSISRMLDAIGARRVNRPADWVAGSHVNTVEDLARFADSRALR